MSWYKVTLTGDMARRHGWGFHDEVFEAWKQARTDDDVPYPTKDAVVFKLKDEPPGTYTFFFSPDAARSYTGLIRHFGGEKCFQPSKAEATVYVGPPEAVSLLAD
jgi:hypothetical protein